MYRALRLLSSIFLILGLIGIVLGSIGVAANSQPQAGTKEVTITQETRFSWPIVTLLIGLGVTVGSVAAAAQFHYTRADIHQTERALGETFQRRDLCATLHQTVVEDLAEIKAALNIPHRKAGR
jgi:uncharacterized membrane protein YciS (DUF1049 family)